MKKVDGQLIQSQVRKPEPELKEIYDVIVENHGDDVKAEELIAAIRPFYVMAQNHYLMDKVILDAV